MTAAATWPSTTDGRTAGAADAANDEGLAHTRARRDGAALAAFRRALAIDPGHVPALANLGLALWRLGRPSLAAEALLQAHARAPDDAEVAATLAEALLPQGRFIEARTLSAKAAETAGADPFYRSNALFCLCYDETIDPATRLALHCAAGRAMEAATPAAAPHDNDPDPDRRLRIGFVSPDFNQHSVAKFFQAVLTGRQPDSGLLYCYQVGERQDEVTSRLASLADRWRDGRTLDDDTLAAQIRADRIDILVDLAGHTAGNRLPVFARRPAPIQATWLGYPDTTGLAAIDVRLTDAIADPPGADAWASERLERLPDGFLCFAPDPAAPAPAPSPCLAGAPLTFGSFNTLAKLSDRTLSLWGRVLAAVPGARLLLKAGGLGDPAIAARLEARCAAAGIPRHLLSLHDRIAEAAGHLGLYGSVDIALDPTPYNGTTTSCEALWQGVPVVTLAGDRHAARVGASLLTRVGHPELIAADPDQYVQIAASLAADPARLAAMRAGLRGRMQASPLTDAPRFAAAMEALWRKLWRAWCTAQRARSPS